MYTVFYFNVVRDIVVNIPGAYIPDVSYLRNIDEVQSVEDEVLKNNYGLLAVA